jgi:signal transduction histidine kinase
MTQRRPARWPILLSLALMLSATATLVWLRDRLERQERSTLLGAVRLFESTEALGRPESRQLKFSTVESLAHAIEESEFVTELRVMKAMNEGSWPTVYPFSAALLEPSWSETPGWVYLPVGGSGNQVGALFFKLDNSNLRAVDRAIGVFAVAFMIGLGVLIFRQQEKEAQLGRTVDELEARRAEVIGLERLALAGQLSANIFHDLKKPILNIKHEVDDALESQAQDAPELLTAIRQQTELFLTMMRDLGFEDFVRGGGDTSEWCDLAEGIARSLRLVRYERGDVEVTVTETGAMPLVFGPPHRLVQLFSNLALNAFQAMKGKGTLTISLVGSGESCVVTFGDSGPGISETQRAKLFTPFSTTRASEGGSGLGLYISRKIVADLGGTIRLLNSGPGATFEITLRGESTPPANTKK